MRLCLRKLLWSVSSFHAAQGTWQVFPYPCKNAEMNSHVPRQQQQQQSSNSHAKQEKENQHLCSLRVLGLWCTEFLFHKNHQHPCSMLDKNQLPDIFKISKYKNCTSFEGISSMQNIKDIMQQHHKICTVAMHNILSITTYIWYLSLIYRGHTYPANSSG